MARLPPACFHKCSVPTADLPCCRRSTVSVSAAKQLHFNKDGEAMKRMQAGVDKLATVVGVTLGPKVRACSQASQQLLVHSA